MEDTFKSAAEQPELSSFDLAKAMHERLRYSNPALAFNVTREFVLPELKDLGTDQALSLVLKAFSPETQNIDIEDRIKLPFAQSAKKSLRDLVFPKEKIYEETGSESNRQLARILNKLTDLGKTDPIDAMRRHDTGDRVLHLPADPDAARERKMTDERLRKGEQYKEDTLKILLPELQRLLYDGSYSIDTRLQYALHIMHEKLVDSGPVQKAVNKVINDFGTVGALLKDGHSLKESVAIIKRTEAARTARADKKTNLTKEIS